MAKAVSANALKVLNYIRENADKDMTAADIAEALDMSVKSVNPIITSGLIGTREPKKNLVERVPATVELEDGTVKGIKFIKLTENGKNYDHSAAQAEDAAAAAQQ